MILTRPLKINETSHFTNDLGLDSLDTVEVVMAIEEVCLLSFISFVFFQLHILTAAIGIQH